MTDRDRPPLSFFPGNRDLPISFSLFGYGLSWAWYWMFFNTSRIAPLATDDMLTLSILRGIGLFVTFCMLIAFSLHSTKGALKPDNDKTLGIIASVAGIVSVPALFFGQPLPGLTGIIVCGLGWIAWGIVAALLNYTWIKTFSALKKRELCLYVPGSFILAGCLVYILCYLPHTTSLVLTALMPAASGLVFTHARSRIPYEEAIENENLACERSKQVLPTSLRKLLVAILIYTIIYYALIAPLGSRRGDGFESNAGFMLLAPLAVSVFIILITWTSNENPRLERIYQLVMPVMVTSLVVFPFVRDTSLAFAGMIASIGYFSFDIITWFVLYDSACHKDAPPLRGFLAGRSASIMGTFLGYSLSNVLVIQEWFRDKDVFTPLCMAAVVILVTATVMLLQESSLFFSSAGTGPETPPDELTEAPTGDPFAEMVATLSEKFDLTPRETEVFALLARGRSNRYIEEQLVISKHTVDSHVTHIYRKCGVNSRQQIIDLVDEAQG